MKFKQFTNPKTGKPAVGTVEVLMGLARLTEPDAEGNVASAGETEVDWNGQKSAAELQGHAVMEDADGNQWYSEVDE